MPFWQQQLRKEISLAQVIPEQGLRLPLDPVSNASSQDTGQRHAQTRSPPQKHAQPVATGDTGRWTVPRDALAPLGRSPPPRPGEWNVHRERPGASEEIPISPQNLSPTLQELFQWRGPGSSPPACVLNMSSELRVDGVVARKKTSFVFSLFFF